MKPKLTNRQKNKTEKLLVYIFNQKDLGMYMRMMLFPDRYHHKPPMLQLFVVFLFFFLSSSKITFGSHLLLRLHYDNQYYICIKFLRKQTV